MAKKKSRSDADRRTRQCERLARLFQTLKFIMGSGRWDADSLAEELGCSRRTVHRMLQTLSLAGVPWYFCKETQCYRVRPGYRFPGMASVEPVPVKEEKPSEVKHEQMLKSGEELAEAL